MRTGTPRSWRQPAIGTAYRAADWLPMGLTRGYARHGGRYVHHGQPKVMWVRALVPQACARLADPFTKPEQSGGAWLATGQFHGSNWPGPSGLRERLASMIPSVPRHSPPVGPDYPHGLHRSRGRPDELW